MRTFNCAGTIGDAFIISCRVYPYTNDGDIKCVHYTRHKHLHNLIKEIYSLNPKVHVEFANERAESLGGFFPNIEGNVLLDRPPEVFPSFDLPSTDKFNLPDNYTVVNIKSGRKGQSYRSIPDKEIKKIIVDEENIVFIGNNEYADKYDKHDNCINLSNKTTIKEAIAVIKGSANVYSFAGIFSLVSLSFKKNTTTYVSDKKTNDGMDIRTLTEWAKYSTIKAI
jgi:ADP-heptose:LPS heptosyltransferase